MPVKKILVVDDSPTERHVLVELLTRNGYQVITAENGEEGIEKAKAELPDLVLMDVVMPGLNGYQATRTLTRDEATKNIPVIVCTSKAVSYTHLDVYKRQGELTPPGMCRCARSKSC